VDQPILTAPLHDAEPGELAQMVFDPQSYVFRVENEQEVGRRHGAVNPPKGFDDLHPQRMDCAVRQRIPEIVSVSPSIALWHRRTSVGPSDWQVTSEGRIILTLREHCSGIRIGSAAMHWAISLGIDSFPENDSMSSATRSRRARRPLLDGSGESSLEVVPGPTRRQMVD